MITGVMSKKGQGYEHLPEDNVHTHESNIDQSDVSVVQNRGNNYANVPQNGCNHPNVQRLQRYTDVPMNGNRGHVTNVYNRSMFQGGQMNPHYNQESQNMNEIEVNHLFPNRKTGSRIAGILN